MSVSYMSTCNEERDHMEVADCRLPKINVRAAEQRGSCERQKQVEVVAEEKDEGELKKCSRKHLRKLLERRRLPARGRCRERKR